MKTKKMMTKNLGQGISVPLSEKLTKSDLMKIVGGTDPPPPPPPPPTK